MVVRDARESTAPQRRRQRVCIRAAQLPVLDGFAGLDQFVAGGDHHECRLLADSQPRHACTSRGRHVRRFQLHSGFQQQRALALVACARVDVLAGSDRYSAASCATPSCTEIRSTGTTASQPAGSIAPVIISMQSAGSERVSGRVARGLRCLDPESRARDRARSLTRDAIHRHPVEGRLVAFGVDVFAQHRPGTVTDRQGLDRQAGKIPRDQLFSFRGRQHDAPDSESGLRAGTAHYCGVLALKTRSCSLNFAATPESSSTAASFFCAYLAASCFFWSSVASAGSFATVPS